MPSPPTKKVNISESEFEQGLRRDEGWVDMKVQSSSTRRMQKTRRSSSDEPSSSPERATSTIDMPTPRRFNILSEAKA